MSSDRTVNGMDMAGERGEGEMNDRAVKVLEQYDLEVTATRRGRGSYILDTPNGIRILSDCTYSEHKAQFQNRVMEQICLGVMKR